MAQQKPTTTKPAATSRTNKPTTPAPAPRKPIERYTVKQEFWESVLNSLPPWGDEIAAIVLIVFGIVSFLSLVNVSADATLSTAWANALRSLFGYGSVIVSGGILALGIVLLLPKMGVVIKLGTRRILAIELSFLAALALLHLLNGDTELRALARAGEGGGYVGWVLSYIISGLIGNVPAIIFYVIILIISVGVVFGLRVSNLKTWLQNTSQKLGVNGQTLQTEANAVLEKRANRPQTPAALNLTPPTVGLPTDAASSKRATQNVLRIRPDLEHLPPSMRPGAAPAAKESLSQELGLSEPSLLTLDNLKANFNAIGTVKGKKGKEGYQIVERPDGRIKRFFSVSDMKEVKKPMKRDPNLPPLEMLRDIELTVPSEQEINNNVVLIENTLLEFEIDVDVVDVKVGPTVTQFAVQPFRETNSEGETVVQRTRINKIAALASDLALGLSAKRLRLETPVPGQTYVGIEVPNRNPSVVALRSVIESKMMQDQMVKAKSPLFIPLGRDVSGAPLGVDLAAMPHLLIAGTTGSGKSVCLAALATALVLNNTPDNVKLVMMDPKMVELNRFNGVPHLLGPVETDQERIIEVLQWCTREMDRRYKLLEEYAVRNIDSFNARLGRRQKDEYMPYIVILIDEIGDLMLSRPDETERTITRLAQKARAAGMHMVIATQRPSVDVITGLIKANFPSRISFAVASGTDSRVILDTVGAENLLGRGDMLYLASDAAGPKRIQGCFVSDDEVRMVVDHWKNWSAEQIAKGKLEDVGSGPWEKGMTRREVLAETDPMLEQAIELVIGEGEASASLIQRKLGLGYPRAARIVDLMAELGIIGEAEAGARSRKVLIKKGEDPFKAELEKRAKRRS
ncbi:MAG: DNA translocase FtsK [Chloroflexi bacterium]|nr:DNA translocase FtsK [Chloroflexota bacterium]MCC6895649.1 DNA translocase FtsK [Anaerolineae bacterium]